MKKIRYMNLAELAAYVQTKLRAEEIEVVLSGGATVSFYSGDKYVSKDVDLVNVRFAKRSKVKTVMEKTGFQAQGRYFSHPSHRLRQGQVMRVLFWERPAGPGASSVGDKKPDG